jgi:ABC transporter substrate binding protein
LGTPDNAYDRSLVEAFRDGLRQVGLIENRDIVLDVAWTTGNFNETVTEVLKRGADLLIPCGSSASVAARLQTTTIPIVFLSVGDPIAMGLADPSWSQCNRVQRYSRGLERQAGGHYSGIERTARHARLRLAYGMARCPKSLSCNRASR